MLLVTAIEMRELDRMTIDGGHASGADLMERAGRGVAAAVERRWGSMLGLRTLVLCGAGNNGGDGFVSALALKERGAHVRVALVRERVRVHGDALHHLERLEAAGVHADEARDEDALRRLAGEADAWDFAVDALLGTGARGDPEGAIAAAVQVLRELDEAGTHVVAVDLPTGIDADTGRIARRAVRADLTVTFGAVKRGQALYPGRAFVGALEVVDIGLAPPPADAAAYRVEWPTASEMARRLPARDPRAHKSAVGRVVVVGGSAGLSGAVALAARAASRAGAGYVQMAAPASLHDVLETKLTEEMTIACPETPARSLAVAAREPILEHLERADALALGSGMSRHPEAARLVRLLLESSPRPIVLDADGLNAVVEATDLLARAAAPCVVTPHLGEMSRLTGVAAPDLESRRIDAAREWAREWKCVVVLKGAPTVTAAPDGRATVNPTGNPGMATAGMGDVLTGITATLLAQGLDPYDAARTAVYVHGLAGDVVARDRGERGMTAGDVVEALPRACRELTDAEAEDAAKRRPKNDRGPSR